MSAATEHVPASARAEDECLRLAAMINSSDDAIIGKTPEGIITSWNDGATRLYGFAPAEAIGQAIALIIPPDRPEEMNRILERIRQGERIAHHETVRQRKDGSLLDVSVSVSPIVDRTGRFIGASSIARDITERRRAEAALLDSERRLAFILEGTNVGTWEWNVATGASSARL